MPSFYSSYQNGFRARTDVTYISSSIENNTSTVLIQGFIEAQSGWWFTNASITAQTYIANPTGSTASHVDTNTAGRTVSSGGSVMVSNITRTVAHRADGTISFAVSTFVQANNLITFGQWAGGDLTLPTIPRATKATVPGPLTAGEPVTISLPRASSSFTHRVSYGFGSVTGEIAGAGSEVGVSVSWTPPLSLLEQIPSAVSGQGSIWVTTWQGSTQIGSGTTTPITIQAAASVVPTVTNVTWQDANPTVAANIGAFIAGQSLVKGQVTATGVYGSSIVERRLKIGATQLSENTPIVFSTGGTVAATGEAVDGRGRVGSLAADFNVLAYAPPTVSAIQVRRATSGGAVSNTGTYLRLDMTAAVQSLIVASVQKNAMTIVVKTRLAGGTSWTTRNTITPGLTYNTNVLVSGGGVYLVTNSYDVLVEVSDKAGVLVSTQLVVTAGTVTLDLNGVSVGVGKYHERGGLDVAGHVYSNGSIMCPVGGVVEWYSDTIPTGYLLLDGQAVSRTTYAELFALWGTTFGAGNGTSTFNVPDRRNRVALGKSADADTNTVGQTGGAKTHLLTSAQSGVADHRHVIRAAASAAAGGPDDGFARGYSSVDGNFRSGGPAALTGGTMGSNGYGSPTGAQAAAQAHNNMQPFIVANFIVRAL